MSGSEENECHRDGSDRPVSETESSGRGRVVEWEKEEKLEEQSLISGPT
jgi:hypothetical protein